jgi:hypothetical protein
LDALVAEVIGWKWATFGGRKSCLLHPSDWPETIEASWSSWRIGKEGEPMRSEHVFFDSARPFPRYRPIPPYSTDISAAVSAAEEARKARKIDAWILYSAHSGNATPYARVLFPGGDGTGRYGDSPAHALSLALLAACGAEEAK